MKRIDWTSVHREIAELAEQNQQLCEGSVRCKYLPEDNHNWRGRIALDWDLSKLPIDEARQIHRALSDAISRIRKPYIRSKVEKIKRRIA